MRSLFIIALILISSSMSAQKLMNTISKEVCNCLTLESMKNSSADIQPMVEKCFQKSYDAHSQEFEKEYGAGFLNDENSNVAYNFGIELGKILSKNCDAFITIIANQQKLLTESADSLLNLGQEKINNGQYDEAIAVLSKGISMNNKKFEYYNKRGQAYFYNEMFYEAISDFLKVVELSPDNTIAHHNIAYTKYWVGDYNGALKATNSSRWR